MLIALVRRLRARERALALGRVSNEEIDEFATWYYFNADESDPRVLMGRRICEQAKLANKVRPC